MKFRSRTVIAVVTAAMIAASPVAMAREAGTFASPDTGEEMLFDAVFVRPFALVGTALGTVAFVFTLPFTLLGQNVEEAGKQLVLKPGEYTFVRPLGHFAICRDASGVC